MSVVCGACGEGRERHLGGMCGGVFSVSVYEGGSASEDKPDDDVEPQPLYSQRDEDEATYSREISLGGRERI